MDEFRGIGLIISAKMGDLRKDGSLFVLALDGLFCYIFV
jgi:hypothetical protein